MAEQQDTPVDRIEQAEVLVNGQPLKIQAGLSISTLLSDLGIHGRAIAVELNGEIQPRLQFEKCELKSGDRLEIVTLVGGG